MTSYRVTILFEIAQFEQLIEMLKYVGGGHKLFVCNSNIDLYKLKRHERTILSLIHWGWWGIRGYVEAFKVYSYPLLEFYVEEVPLGSQKVNVTPNSSPTPMPLLTLETQNSFVPSPSYIPYEPLKSKFEMILGLT